MSIYMQYNRPNPGLRDRFYACMKANARAEPHTTAAAGPSGPAEAQMKPAVQTDAESE